MQWHRSILFCAAVYNEFEVKKHTIFAYNSVNFVL